jgi:hypothetical protein
MLHGSVGLLVLLPPIYNRNIPNKDKNSDPILMIYDYNQYIITQQCPRTKQQKMDAIMSVHECASTSLRHKQR